MAFKTLRLQETGQVARIEMARPEARNALGVEQMHELTDCLVALDKDPEVRAVVLSGEGRSFCAGADLAWIRAVVEGEPETWIAGYDAMDRLLITAATLTTPFVCVTTGSTVGGGVALAAAADLVVAAESSSFHLAELHLGMVPTVIVPIIAERIGRKALARLCLCQSRLSASEAVEKGLADMVVADDALERAVEDALGRVLGCAPEAAATFKKMIADLPDNDLLAGMKRVREVAMKTAGFHEMQEGIQAVLEKLKPSWAPADRTDSRQRRESSFGGPYD